MLGVTKTYISASINLSLSFSLWVKDITESETKKERKRVCSKLSGVQKVKVKVVPINCVCVCVCAASGGTIGLYTLSSMMLHSAGEKSGFLNIRELRGAFVCNKDRKRELQIAQ